MSRYPKPSYGVMSYTFQKYMEFAACFEEEFERTEFNKLKELNDIQEQFELYLCECLTKELERIGLQQSCGLFTETERWLGYPQGGVPKKKNLSQVTVEELDIWIFLFLSNMTNSFIKFIKYPYEDSFELTEDEETIEEMKKYINMFHRYHDGIRDDHTDCISKLTLTRIYEEYFQTIYFGTKHIYIKQKLKEQCEMYYSDNGLK